MRLVAIAGQARMGKDTLGALLCGDLPRLAFSTRVKRLMCELYDVTPEWIEKWKTCDEVPPRFEVTCRRALQTIGDELRTIRLSVWIDATMRELGERGGVICDLRYFNEARRVRDRGGINVLIGRPCALSDDANPSEANRRPVIEWFLRNTTASLVECDEVANAPVEAECFDFFVRNDGTIVDLEATARDLSCHIDLKFRHDKQEE